MRNFTWWQAFWLSFFSRQLYQSVARQWRGIGSLYLLILSALVVMPVTLEIRNGFQSFIEQDLPLYLDELPELTIQGGYASTPEDRPYIINEKGTTDPFIVIDTSGEFTSLEQTSAPVLITNDRLYIRKSDIETRSFDFSTFTDMTIDRELLDSFLSTTSKFVMPLTYVILVLFAWSWRITQAMLYALLAGWRISLLFFSKEIIDPNREGGKWDDCVLHLWLLSAQMADRTRSGCPGQGSRSYPLSIYFCAEVLLARLYKTMSCEVKAAARRAIIDVVRVAAGALVDHGAYAAVQVQENSAQSTACPTRPRLPRSHGNGNEGCEVW